MTLAILFFSEITPKTLAKRYAERFVLAALPLITLSYWILLPLAWPLVRGTQGVSRLLTGSDGAAKPVHHLRGGRVHDRPRHPRRACSTR